MNFCLELKLTLSILDEWIYVTRPNVPASSNLFERYSEVIGSRWLTNNGPQVSTLTNLLSEYSERSAVCCANGTLGLMSALMGLGVKPGGKVLTTPFSFTATALSISMVGAIPVFSDVDPQYLNLCPHAAEERIAKGDISAILAVHCYGTPCDIDGLGALGSKFGIPVIYDAAHCHGVMFNGRPLVSYGDAAVESFHATKTFSTIEGGAVYGSPELALIVESIGNFGFDQSNGISSRVGMNSKMNEFQAAFGLELWDSKSALASIREQIYYRYVDLFSNCPYIVPLCTRLGVESNYGYFPVRVKKGLREPLIAFMAERKIQLRKYFSPLLSDMPAFSGHSEVSFNVPLSEARLAEREIVCLPIYASMTDAEWTRIRNSFVEFLAANSSAFGDTNA